MDMFIFGYSILGKIAWQLTYCDGLGIVYLDPIKVVFMEDNIHSVPNYVCLFVQTTWKQANESILGF